MHWLKPVSFHLLNAHEERETVQAQAFCVKDVNAGSSADSLQVTANQLLQNRSKPEQPAASSAQLRHQYVQALHNDGFLQLVHRITAAHAQARHARPLCAQQMS